MSNIPQECTEAILEAISLLEDIKPSLQHDTNDWELGYLKGINKVIEKLKQYVGT
jgi:hypothetical protein